MCNYVWTKYNIIYILFYPLHTRHQYTLYTLKLKSSRDVVLLVVKSEVRALERIPNIYSDMTTRPLLPREGLVTIMVTDVTSGGNKHFFLFFFYFFFLNKH